MYVFYGLVIKLSVLHRKKTFDVKSDYDYLQNIIKKLKYKN